MDIKTIKTELGGKELSFEIGKFAGLADGSVTVRYGDTVVLATAVMAPEAKDGTDFFPLQVEYEERLYAAGKISGSRFIKREGRPSDQAILTSRLIDRSVRPMFSKYERRDVQVIVTVLSFDNENDPDVVSIVAASAALMASTVPFRGPIGAVRVGLVDDKFIINPTRSEREKSSLDLVVSGTSERVVMIEAGANQVPEETVIKAIAFAQENLKPTLEIQKKLVDIINPVNQTETGLDTTMHDKVADYVGGQLDEILTMADKEQRETSLAAFETQVLSNFDGDYKQVDLKVAFAKVVEKKLRAAILDKGIRPDGRHPKEIRPLFIEVGLLPRTHGSGLFTRGQTQALTIATLGAPGEEQIIETMDEESTKRFMHHYNFPPFSTGEVRPVRGASRREIGHGALAERALYPVIPDQQTFPYTIRLVSEVLSSNGSSSMASTCGSTLALMDAGVPILEPVSGIAMGLMTDEKGKYCVLSDLQGLEDFSGDMDFKIAGTKNGITAIQLDVKIAGLTPEIIHDTVMQAKEGRMFILGEMLKVIPEVRKDLSQFAPRITAIKIDPEKIGIVIGGGGKTINKIVTECGGKEITSIDIDDDGTIMVSSTDPEMSKKAISWIEGLTKEIKIGEKYTGEVTNIVKDRMRGNEIGAIVQITPNQDGMVHISEVAPERIEKVSDVLKVGQTVNVVVTDIDKERGRIGLSIKRYGEQNQPVEQRFHE
ncbi:MAG: polyribonucleotide nucleotidyltransferase [Patescibacteria group bacterium]|jgi:polyribonucleotide nucleotidyltransferase